MPKAILYEAFVRPNGKGGWEVAEPSVPVGEGQGNYPTCGDAYGVACFNYEPSRIKECEPAVAKQKTTLKLRAVKGGA